MSRFVLDASVAACWWFDDQLTPYAESIATRFDDGDEAVVSFVWPLEMLNVLIRAERKGVLSAAQAAARLEELKGWRIEIDRIGVGRCFDYIMTIARENRISAYDASYLELAMRLGIRLATADKELAKAAKACGVKAA